VILQISLTAFLLFVMLNERYILVNVHYLDMPFFSTAMMGFQNICQVYIFSSYSCMQYINIKTHGSVCRAAQEAGAPQP